MPEFENGAINLKFRLLRVAPIDEQRCFVFQYHRNSGRAGKTGKPQQPLGVSRYILVLVLVRTWNDKSVSAGLFELPAQFGHASGTICRTAEFGKGLKSTFKHRNASRNDKESGGVSRGNNTTNEGQFAIGVGDIHPIADDESVGTNEPNEVGVYQDRALAWLL